MKNRIQIVILLFLTSVLNLNVVAQNNFKPGYIITLEKDTVRGFVSESTDMELGLKMEFKKEVKDTESKVYVPKEIAGFGFNYGRNFERKIIVNSKENMHDSIYVFAKTLVKGKIDLWVWRKKKHDVPELFLLNNESHQTAHLTKGPSKEVKWKDGRTFLQDDLMYVSLLNNIKGDTASALNDNSHYVRYAENTIKNDICVYNKRFQKDYPLTKYEEPFSRSHDITVGAFPTNPRGFFGRIGFYQNKMFYEKSKNLSLIRGITFTSSSSRSTLSIIPIGVKFQASSKIIIPYCYIGFGVAALRVKKDYIGFNHEYLYTKYRYMGFPTVNACAGIKIKVGSKYILFELIPSLGAGLLPNIGLSF
jgi:hypothetical protein